MAPRPYASAVRKDAELETMRRIVAATVQLHAEKGVMATTHAEIAERAGVSVPTVYKHFPTRNALLPACMGDVVKGAPPIDPAAILAAPDLDTRLALLVEQLHARYRYFHPWVRWTAADAPFLPEIAGAAKSAQEELESLVKAVLADTRAGEVSVNTAAVAVVLLDYGAWQRLDGLLGNPEVVSEAVAQALRLLVSPYTKVSVRP
jgi:AcrR family transcriptional regulator